MTLSLTMFAEVSYPLFSNLVMRGAHVPARKQDREDEISGKLVLSG